MPGNVDGLKSLLMLIHILYIDPCGQWAVPDALSWHPNHVTALGTLEVEPSFFGSVFKFTVEEPDKEMAALVSLDRSHTLEFFIAKHFDLPVVVRL